MTTRRTILKGGLAAAALTSAPSSSVRRRSPRARAPQAVMHADLRVLDPIWTTANITAYHGAMIYDTLFGLDANFTPQPQMVSKWGLSDDKLTYTFELRDGLKFSDGAGGDGGRLRFWWRLVELLLRFQCRLGSKFGTREDPHSE